MRDGYLWPGVQPAAGPIRLLVVDDQPIFMAGLRQIIDSSKSMMEIVGFSSDLTEALALAGSLNPTVVMFDMGLGENIINDFIPGLLKVSQARLLVCTAVKDADQHHRAAVGGIHGLVEKTASPQKVLQAIEQVHLGQIWLDRSTMSRLIENSRKRILEGTGGQPNHIEQLTPREQEIVQLSCKLANAPFKKLAEVLNVSSNTLRNHMSSIYGKLHVRSRLQLFALMNGRGSHSFMYDQRTGVNRTSVSP